MGFRVLGFRVWGLRFKVWGLGFRVLGFRVQGGQGCPNNIPSCLEILGGPSSQQQVANLATKGGGGVLGVQGLGYRV